MRRYLTLSLLLSVMALNACGTRGSLYLPSPPKTPPPAAQPDPETAKPASS
ncbi:LPS translocon maturation chaperone LptM [Propionivibrio sp.]|uniref:LPS translocon maturation chaperone LptM n=1 Tax=Propionivibrio sp. TaxID=2212460 RepID=UPI0039E4B767